MHDGTCAALQSHGTGPCCSLASQLAQPLLQPIVPQDMPPLCGSVQHQNSAEESPADQQEILVE